MKSVKYRFIDNPLRRRLSMGQTILCETVPIKKKCSLCGKLKELSKFHLNKRHKHGVHSKCKQCRKKEYYANHEENLKRFCRNYAINRERIRERQREYRYRDPLKKMYYDRMANFLWGNQRGSGYLRGQGICLHCDELNPFLLENHHIFGRKVSDFTISMCANCHILSKRYPAMLQNFV